MNIDFPALRVRIRERALREVGADNIYKVVAAYLFDGMAYREMDSAVLGLSARSKGFASMGVIHHFGLHDKHKGIFKDTTPTEAMKILAEKVPNLMPYLTNLVAYREEQPNQDSSTSAYEEGQKRLKTHLVRERNTKVIKDAKAEFVKKHGHLYCEVCGFDFKKVYGFRGDGFIEGHHKHPISQNDEPVTTTTADIAMVCSNCHSMLHRTPFLSVDELSNLIHNK